MPVFTTISKLVGYYSDEAEDVPHCAWQRLISISPQWKDSYISEHHHASADRTDTCNL